MWDVLQLVMAVLMLGATGYTLGVGAISVGVWAFNNRFDWNAKLVERYAAEAAKPQKRFKALRAVMGAFLIVAALAGCIAIN